MKRASERGRLLFVSGVLLVVAALSWASVSVLALEQEEARGRATNEHQAALRLALWRMDGWLAPQIAREAARPYFEYEAYFAQEEAYTNRLSKIQAGDVLSPSPLLAFESDWIQLHFQVDPRETWSSPQLPTGNWLDLALSNGLVDETRLRQQELFDTLTEKVEPAMLNGCVAMAELEIRDWIATPDPEPQTSATRAAMEQKLRAQNTFSPTQSYAAPLPSVDVGPLSPVWLSEPALELCFVRSVQRKSGTWLQGFVVDWPKLEEALLQQVEDLFPEARLAPVVEDGSDGLERRLASLTACIETPPPAGVARVVGFTPTRRALLATWLAVAVAIGAVGLAMRAAVRFGEKSHRFASAVTHELRTPLTTFQMYSEMLATGMVTDEAKRQRYLQTLERESHRLSHLVENVLAYARLEDGRATLRRAPIAWPELRERALEGLANQVQAEDVEWTVQDQVDAKARLETDAEAVRQILINLVDNALKYGVADEGSGTRARGRISLECRADEHALFIDVDDRGPGIPPERRTDVFLPFHRGDRVAADPQPGIGLGLALARSLARDLGGDLEAIDHAGGARFRLTLPLVP